MKFYQIDSKSMIKSQVLLKINIEIQRNIEVKSYDIK